MSMLGSSRRLALTRFERKIVAAIAAVALVPLLGALLLGEAVLREQYRIGVNPRVRAQLEDALEVYQTLFVTLRIDAERTADAVALDWRLHEAIQANDPERVSGLLDSALERYSNVARVVVQSPRGTVLARSSRADRLDTRAMRLLRFDRDVAGQSGPRVSVTVATSAARFRDYQKAGEIVEVFRRLEAGTTYFSRAYLAIYSALLLSVIVLAMALGIVLSRRVTRRVAILAEATQRVGAGDLSVQVPTGSSDEVGELTRAFNEMVRDMRESRERIDYLQRIGAWQEFARRLAHEIKNPLTPIQLAVQELHRSYAGDDPRYRRMLEDSRAIVEEEIATLRRLVGEFSAFAKLPEARLEAADLGDFVRDASRTLGAIDEDSIAAPLPDVEIRVDAAGDPLPVRIDTMMLKRCLDNLVRNAVQAVHGARRGDGLVVVATRLEGAHALVEVRDNGPGVPVGARARVFDPYYTTKADGTGLGLAIVKKVVLEHGGDIECREAPEGGATFQIRLPLARPRR